jgi:hypothetical protein
MNLVARGFYTAEPLHMTTLVYLPCQCAKVQVHESSAARARACVSELLDLAPDVRPELKLVVYTQRVHLLGK